MFTMAIKWGYAKTNPAKEVKLLKEPPGRLRYLKPEEVKALLASCTDHIRPVVVTALIQTVSHLDSNKSFLTF